MDSDKRFAHVATDPKFRRIPKNERKVKIDKRFQSMFKDKKFKVKYTVDKRGRPVSHSTTEDLKRYYELSSEDDSESDSNENHEISEASSIEDEVSSNETQQGNEIEVKHKNDKTVSKRVKKRLKNLDVDYARGEGVLLSDSSSDDEESEEEISDTDDIDHKWGELDGDADKVDETTCRLAACNMDWDRIRATDLMVLFNSFVPSGGMILSVNIYPSEYGKKRMAEEDVKGPIELIEAKNKQNNDEDENEEGSKYHMEKLRQYQLNRLKYFYAVISFDSPNTANKIYTECDGMEYESSSTKIDLRFIPDDMSFENDQPRESCDKMPEVSKYKPRFFTTTALQQAKVDLTWDETNADRQEITEKISSGKIDEITDTDIQAYLASSSGEEESENEENNLDDEQDDNTNPIDKYKALLMEIENKEKEKDNKDVQMEISWGIELEKKTEQLVETKRLQNENKTPFQQYLDKRKEKRKEKKQQCKNDDDNDSESDIPSGIDMNHPYFAEEFDKPEFKKKNTNKKKEESDSDIDEDNKQRQAELELLLLNEDDNKKHFSLKKIQNQESDSKTKKKRANKKEIDNSNIDDFQVNVNDERFSALFTSHHYNIDPTDPHYKKTKAMETLISEKIKRRVEDDDNKTIKKSKLQSKSSKNAELSVLVKSVKRNAQSFANKNK